MTSSVARAPEVAPMLESTGHTIKVSGTNFMLPPKYHFIRAIGHGAYGVVISAMDGDTKEKVAIKKIPRAFEDLVDAKRILREVRLLRQFSHDNIICIKDILPPPSLPGFEDVYIVSNLMETDLHRIIYSPQPLSMEHVQYFVYQVLRALKYMHSANVLHRDLKPSNLLLNSNCELKVCDLGLARGISNAPQVDLTEYVVTRWYRAPEIMLACQEYTKAIDVWSVGCIFAELIHRVPLFPGEDYIHQLQIICEKLGRPEEEDLGFVTSQKAKKFILGLPPSKPRPMRELFGGAGEQAVDLLSKMLVFDPRHRIPVDRALEHPFMESLHSPEDEPEAEAPFSFAFENEELDKARLQRLIWDEMLHYHPEARGHEGLTTAAVPAAHHHHPGTAPAASPPRMGAAAAAAVVASPVLTPASDVSAGGGGGGVRALKRQFSHLGEEYGGESPLCSSGSDGSRRAVRGGGEGAAAAAMQQRRANMFESGDGSAGHSPAMPPGGGSGVPHQRSIFKRQRLGAGRQGAGMAGPGDVLLAAAAVLNAEEAAAAAAAAASVADAAPEGDHKRRAA